MPYKFLIQSEKGNVLHDFGFTMIHAVLYNEWYTEGNRRNPDYYCDIADAGLIGCDDFTGHIPIGSVEFVQDFYKYHYGIQSIRPVNIPGQLNAWEYLKRTIYTFKTDKAMEFKLYRKAFVKEISTIKRYANIVGPVDVVNGEVTLDPGEYMVSDYVEDIESEWRAFVFRGELVGLNNYSGCFDVFPDAVTIRQMITAYKDSPMAYTLDVGIHEKLGTFLIEAHQFWSCGLYGFSDYVKLPQMYIATHKEIINGRSRDND